jgi:hypothetical protein
MRIRVPASGDAVKAATSQPPGAIGSSNHHETPECSAPRNCLT